MARVGFISPRSLSMLAVMPCPRWRVIVSMYNGDDVLPAVFKSVRSRAFFSSGNAFRSHPGFLTLRAPDCVESARFSSSFFGLKLAPSKWRYLSPPLAGNANRWAVVVSRIVNNENETHQR